MTVALPRGEQHIRPDHAGHLEDRIRRARARAMGLASLAIRWERAWPRLWPLATILSATVGLFLTDLLPALPGWLHVAALVVAGSGLVWSVYYAIRGHTAPSDGEILKRIRRDSQFRHDPLSVLDDDIHFYSSTPDAIALWRTHRERTLATLGNIRVSLPSPCLARHDPLGLRALGFLILVIGLFAGSGDAWNRVVRALSPGVGVGGSAVALADVWVTPPSYTGLAPFYLSNAKAPQRVPAGPVGPTPPPVHEMPAGSRIIAQVGIPGAGSSDSGLSLGIAGLKAGFDALGSGGYRTDITLDAAHVIDGESRLVIRRGETEVAGWPVRVVSDKSPTIEFVKPPSTGPGGTLRITYKAADDFGIAGTNLVIRNPAFKKDEAGSEPDRVNLPLSRARAQTIETTVTRNTSAHDWAGLPVELQLEVRDANGSVGLSQPFEMILPERTFNNPVARALIEYRKALVHPDEGIVTRVLVGLDRISRHPQMFGNQTSVFLGLRSARARLMLDRDSRQIPSIRKILWEMALHLEDGELAVAGHELAETQKRMMEAISNGNFADHAGQLLNELQSALDRYMEALNKRLAEQGMKDLGDIPGMERFDAQNLKGMIETARELARTGAMDAAEQAMRQLSAMLDTLQQAMNMSPAMQQQISVARKILEQLGSMSQEQQDLLDETYRQLRQMQGFKDLLGGQPQDDQSQSDQSQADQPESNGNPAKSGSGDKAGTGVAGKGSQPQEGARHLAAPQESLRQQLSNLKAGLQDLLGALPPTIGSAERAMNRASEALRLGDPGAAVPSQSDALEMLRQATNSMMQMMAAKLRRSGGSLSLQMQGSQAPDGSDPFGRVGSGAFGTQMGDGSVKVPDHTEIMRSRRIYDELRRRAGERYRPRYELNYIERLLTPF